MSSTPPFVENLGQWATPARFIAHLGGVTVLVEGDAITLVEMHSTGVNWNADVIRFKFEAAQPGRRVTGLDKRKLVHHFFNVIEPHGWHSNVPTFDAIIIRNLYTGVDLTLRVSSNRLVLQLQLDHPNHLNQVAVSIEGGIDLDFGAEGEVIVHSGLADVTLSLTDSLHADRDTEFQSTNPSLMELKDRRVAFTSTNEQQSVALVIDPGLEWATLLDGELSATIISDVLVREDGSVLVTGQTSSADFPTTPGAHQGTWAGGTGTMPSDAIISCFDGSGSELLFSTFLGGANSEGEVSIQLAPDGGIVVAGRAGPGAFPVTPGVFDPTWHAFDAFVAKLSGDGSLLLWGTYLGGDGATSITSLNDIAVDAQGSVFVVGTTQAANFPTTPGAYDTTFNDLSPIPTSDGFISRLSSDGTTLVASTFLGGSNGAGIQEVEITAEGWITVAGGTTSSDFPVTSGAYDTVYEGSDGFIAQFDPMLTTLRFASFVGGSGQGVVRGMDVDASGCITVAGHSNAPGLHTTPGAFDSTFNGGFDGFLARFDPTGSQVIYSTYFGSGGLDLIRDVAVDSAGVATVVGETNGSFFPTTPGAYQTVTPSGSLIDDVFVARFAPDGELFYSTYLGGSSFDGGGSFPELMCVALDPVGSAIVAHRTQSPDFPTTEDAYDTTYSGVGGDGFVAKLSMLPTGIGRFGGSSPGCQGPLAIGAMALPRVGTVRMPLTCNQAPPLSTGWLAVGLPTFDLPVDALGTLGWVDFSLPFLLLPVASSRSGYCQVALRIPDVPDLVGQQFASQFFWPDACGPQGWAASNALAITVQP